MSCLDGCGSDKHVRCNPLAVKLADRDTWRDNTGSMRMTHHDGVRTVTVAARGDMLQDAQRFSFVARRDRDGNSLTMVDTSDALGWSRITVQTSEILRMASALAALLHSGVTQEELTARAKAYASEWMVASNGHRFVAIPTASAESAIQHAFEAGFQAGRKEG